jgi:hypothetical protein
MGFLKLMETAKKGVKGAELGKQGIEKGAELGAKGYHEAEDAANKGYDRAKQDLEKKIKTEWAVRDLNPRPFDYQSNAPPS